MNILSNISPFRKPLFSFTHPLSISHEEAINWVKGVPEGGIGGLEVFSGEQGVSIQLMHHHTLSPSEKSNNESYFHPISSHMENVESFQFYLKKPSFYALTQNEKESWLQHIKNIKGEAWIQILFQKEKQDKWNTLLNQQYEDYLKGITYPSTVTPVRVLQLKIAQISDKFTVSIPVLASFEERKKQTIFRFLIRGYVKGEEQERKEIIDHLISGLNRHKGENEWGVIRKERVKKEQIKQWKTVKTSYLSYAHPFIVESELAALLPCASNSKRTRVIRTEKTIEKVENLFPIFQFLPRGNSQEEPLLLDQFEQELNGALEKLGVIKEEGVQIIGFQQGPTLIRLNILLPKGIRLSDLQKVIADWQTELGITDLSVFQGKEKGTATITVPRKNKQAVFLRNLIDTKSFSDFTKDKILPFVLGANETGEPLYEDLTRVKHLLVAGTTGSGKSLWLLQMILTLLLWVPSKQLMVYLIDPKRVEFPGFSSFKNVKVYTEIEEAKQLLQSLTELMETRYEELGKEGVRNISQYNRKMKDTPMPYVVVVIDEFSDFSMQDDENIVEESIVRLAQKARACGIHLIITTQRPSVDVVTGLIKANLPSRVVFKCNGRNDYSTVLDQKPPFNLLGNGDGVCLMEGRALTRFQGPLIAKDEETMDQIIKDYGENNSGAAPLSLEIRADPYVLETTGPLEELKRYIAFTGETRVTHLRKQMKMRMNDVKELMRELVEEGWLEAPKTRNSGYKLVLSEDERVKYVNSPPIK